MCSQNILQSRVRKLDAHSASAGHLVRILVMLLPELIDWGIWLLNNQVGHPSARARIRWCSRGIHVIGSNLGRPDEVGYRLRNSPQVSTASSAVADNKRMLRTQA